MKKDEKKPVVLEPRKHGGHSGKASTLDSGGGGTTNPPEPGKPTKPGS